jgi:predicted Zn-dependent protease
MKKIILLLLFSSSLILFSACSTVPYTGRSQLMMTSQDEENKMGQEAWREVQKKERLSTNKTYKSAVTRVGKNIAAVSDRPDFKWEFKTFDSQQANAFCLPGGKVAVYTGIFQYISNDAELAAVMGHEVGHAIARHGGERVSQGMFQQAGAKGVAMAAGAKYREMALMAYGIGSNIGVMLPYSRTHEYEADHIGIMLMAKAGYDPRYAISFWQKFSKASETNAFTEYLSTHPMGGHRVTELKKLLPQAMKFYDKAKNKKGSGIKY